ncbi:MAG: hypothetical protein V4579_05355 [Pseudomonadota bacterium]
MTLVRDIACGRSGDKADTLDLTLVAIGEDEYRLLAQVLTAERVRDRLAGMIPAKDVEVYPLPALRALKFVIRGALPGGVYASLRPGLHWQKAATYALLDMPVAQ